MILRAGKGFDSRRGHQKKKNGKLRSFSFAVPAERTNTRVRSLSRGRQTPRKLRLHSPYQGAETRRGHQTS